jgi:hypothetical protein
LQPPIWTKYWPRLTLAASAAALGFENSRPTLAMTRLAMIEAPAPQVMRFWYVIAVS